METETLNTINSLKAKVYDNLVLIERYHNEVKILQEEIGKLNGEISKELSKVKEVSNNNS